MSECESMNGELNKSDIGVDTQQTTAKPSAKQRAGPPQSSVWRELRNLLIKIAAILLFFILVCVLVFGFHRSVDNSMSLSVKNGDLVFFNRWDKVYIAGDVLLLDYEGQRQVRRVVAAAGDTVDISEDGLLVNGAQLFETKTSGQTQRYDNNVIFPLVVGEGQVFVLADSRENATDSRVYGAVNVEDTLGKSWGLFRARDI